MQEAEFAFKHGEVPVGAIIVTLHPKTEVVSGIMAKEASELLKRFFIQKRNLN